MIRAQRQRLNTKGLLVVPKRLGELVLLNCLHESVVRQPGPSRTTAELTSIN
jgi:hypothetical protein